MSVEGTLGSPDPFAEGAEPGGRDMDESGVGDVADRRERVLPARRTLRAQWTPDQQSVPSPTAEGVDMAGSATSPQDGSSEVASGVTREPLPGGRRDRRRQETEQIALLEQADDGAVLLHPSGTDPSGADGTVLARQKAIAERAAALTARARRIQDLSEQYRRSQRGPAPDDPASMHSVSIVVTRDTDAVPGDGTALSRAPITSGLPVVGSGGGVRGTVQAQAVPSVRTSRDAPDASGAPAPTATGPVEARSAFGLDPLDAMTAGLGRVRRVRLLQYSLLGVGGAALLTGIMIIVSSLNG